MLYVKYALEHSTQLPNRSQICFQASQQPKESKKLVLRLMWFK